MANTNTPPFALSAYMADDLVPITKSDTNDIWGNTYAATGVSATKPCNGVLCGTAGVGVVVTARGNTRTIPMQAGYNPIRIKQLLSTNTTASDCHAIP